MPDLMKTKQFFKQHSLCELILIILLFFFFFNQIDQQSEDYPIGIGQQQTSSDRSDLHTFT